MPPLQQPLGHEIASQTHRPLPLHSCPAAHAPHAAPPVPQELLDSDTYGSLVPLPVQQPPGHEVASQTHSPLPLHSRPVAHARHAVPDAPHEVFDSLASCSHVPPIVQQPGHDVPPHVHWPVEHDSPLPHGLQAEPPVPHWPTDCEA